MLKGIKGWDWASMGGYYRCFHKVYQATPHGIIKPLDTSDNRVPEPLRVKFPYNQVYKQVRFYEIEKWGQVNDDQTIEQNSQNLMIIIGNTLFKPQKKEINTNGNQDKSVEHIQEQQDLLLLEIVN